MVINVPEDEPTINAALGAAAEGDTIRVSAITCNESIVIGANLNRIRIVGAGMEKTIIDGTGLPGGSIGIHILDSSLVTIENLSVRHFSSVGIQIVTGDNIIHKVEVSKNGEQGVFINSNGSRNMIMSSEIIGNTLDGVSIEGSINNYVVSNCFLNNQRDGVRSSGSNTLVFKNFIKDNFGDGISLRSSNNFIINNTVMKNDDGVSNTDNDFVFSNKIFKNKRDGILVRGFINLYWANDVRCNGDMGIFLRSGNQHRVVKNTIINNGNLGIEINTNTNDNLIDNNCIKDNTNQGILINPNSNDNVIRSNTLAGNTPDLDNEGMNTLFDNNNCTSSIPPDLCQINNVFNVPGDFEKIQDAIDNIPVAGFTIRVGKGTFKEALTINNIGQVRDRIRIIGAGRGKTIIDGSETVGSIGIDIESSFVTIENLTVQKFDNQGIRMSTCDNIIHCVNTVDNEEDGILIEGGGERNLIIHCESSRNIGDESDGIDVNGNNNYIVCNQFKGNGGQGICLAGEFNLVFQNSCDGNIGAGIETTTIGNQNFIICNSAMNQTTLDGIDIESNACLVLWNKSCGNMDDGIEVNNNCLVWGNVCVNNVDNGIDVDDNENRIVHNIVRNNQQQGINVFPNISPNIVDNNKVIKNNLAGILLDSNDNAVRSNCLTGNNPDIQDNGIDNVIDENVCQTSNRAGVCEDN
ncbi:right-handed parallel beta-helix repeat-containing protein [Chengkuizengella sediminis]|uniref:right-handed parallel beta-helix repeat-containing protein n=1 Tax=Chengkuizengella sediminis TaxID=1885917 RepID=UPI001389C76B|nr:right-handed parallel beta-helix repeat-containing protein [Chengkuizengella sediminis]NDI35280.1 hypothetical protein [Chengkuizengella sediminis]